LTSASLVLATLQTHASGVYVASAVPAKGQFTLHLSKKATKKVKFAWFVVSG
jgi:hypothetical protein